jgi:hypothetical protein
MAVRWFVRTRGARANEDYTWRSFTAEDPSEADRITWRGESCFSLVDDERPGLLLFDDRVNGTVLLVTGLISPNRPTDYQRRLIRASLLGVAPHGDEAGQLSLVAVAVQALRDELAPHLPVSYGPAGEFTIQQEQWARFLDAASSGLATVAGARAIPGKPRRLLDTGTGRRTAADDLSTLYLQHGPALLAGKLAVLWTNILEPSHIGQLLPWLIVSEVADAAAEDFAGISSVSASAIALTEVAANAGKAAVGRLLGPVQREMGRRSILLTFLALAAVAAITAFLVVPNGHPAVRNPHPSSETAWRVADTVGVSGEDARQDGIVATGPDAAFGAALICSPGCSTGQLVVADWDGTVWSQLAPPPVTAGSPETAAIGASSAVNAWVFDTTGTSSHAMHWNGSSWTLTPLAPSSSIFAAAVFGSADVWAFGILANGKSYDLRFDGRRWHRVSLPATLSGGAGSVSALSPTDMWAIATTAGTPVLLHWNGLSWQVAGLPGRRGPLRDRGDRASLRLGHRLRRPTALERLTLGYREPASAGPQPGHPGPGRCRRGMAGR